MSLEVLNTSANLITVTIVAVTALAALIQLRHLRTGNQTQALLSVNELLQGREFREALTLANIGLESAIADPAFREYEIAIFRREQPPVNVAQKYIDMHNAATKVGNTFEVLGVLVKNRIVDADLFVDSYCGIALGSWKRLESHIALGRAVSGNDALLEHYEYLAVISEDWIHSHPSSYPKGVRRFQITKPSPLPSPAAP